MLTRALGLLVLIVSAGLCTAGMDADGDPVLSAYRDAVIAQLGQLESDLPRITRSAEAAAERILSGGNLYVGGQEAFLREACTRAGGLMMAAHLRDETPVTAQDVVLVGIWTPSDEKGLAACRRAKESGACVVLFSPPFETSADYCDLHVSNCSAADDTAVTLKNGARVGPLSPLFDVTALWTWTGELVGAFTRRGKMPVMWESLLLPHSKERAARYNQQGNPSLKRFHADMTLPQQPPGALGRSYLDAVRRQLCGLRGPVMGQLGEIATVTANRVRGGGSLHVLTQSHFTSFEVMSTSVPGWIHATYERWHVKAPDVPNRLAAAMRPDDVFLHLGYYTCAPDILAAVRAADGKSCITLCHAPPAPLTGPQPDMLIDAQWPYGDATVWVPGYDIGILPSSAILQTTIFWTVVAKTEALLAEGG